MRSDKKAVSPLIAAVVLVAVVFSIGILLSGSFTSIFKTQSDIASKTQKCPANALELIYYACKGNKITAVISNAGVSALSNFSIFANINGNIYYNSTPANYQTILSPGDVVTLEAATSYTGPISQLRVSAGGDCPGVYIELTNDTKPIATC